MRVLAITSPDDYSPEDVVKMNRGESEDQAFLRWIKANKKWTDGIADDIILSDAEYVWQEYEV